MKKGIITGINNAQSIAYGCAKAFAAQGAELITTYYSEKNGDFQRSEAAALNIKQAVKLDVRDDAQLEALFDVAKQEWGEIDFLLHSIAFAPKDDLHGRVVDCSRAGFGEAMDVSVHSLIRMAKLAEPLMKNGGSILTVSYYGGEHVVINYNLMGPVKAALEGTVKYLAAELGAKGIRINALSPGPILTRAASGIADFDQLISSVQSRSPISTALTIDDVGAMAGFLISDGARNITGNVMHVDCGYHIMG
jgi:enoyl-[acyl-carrier protein] reductase I